MATLLEVRLRERTSEYEKRWRSRTTKQMTTKQMTSGTARNAPKGPHIQAQKAIDPKFPKLDEDGQRNLATLRAALSK